MDIQNVLGTLLMLYSQITTHLRDRAEWLMSGQFDRMVADYLYPLPIFLHSSRLVLQSPDHAVMVFAHLRDALVDRGVAALRPKISAIDLPRAGRFRVWVDWQEIAFPPEATRISQAVYYCRATDLGLQTEMVNYTHLSMPELNQQFAALALSA
jgi:hypothetical protein